MYPSPLYFHVQSPPFSPSPPKAMRWNFGWYDSWGRRIGKQIQKYSIFFLINVFVKNDTGMFMINSFLFLSYYANI